MNMTFDCVFTDEKPIGHYLIRAARRNLFQDFDLARGERIVRCVCRQFRLYFLRYAASSGIHRSNRIP